jgi:E3 ubiquitin-protein ligase RBX1
MTSTVNSFNFDDEVKIQKIDLKVFWNWNTHNDKCPICRNFIFEPSIGSDNNNKDNSSKAVIGMCGHSFHYDCISNWLKTRHVCPLCNAKWEYVKEKKNNL